MKKPVIARACFQPAKETVLKRILRRCGAYYHSADLFYQELWKQRLANIGFCVLSIERLPYHPVWAIRLRGTLAAQAYLLLSKPVSAKLANSDELMLKQLKAEIRQIAIELGAPIKSDCYGVVRTGTYLRVSFIWPLGKPGLWLKPDEKPDAFSFLIRPWLRKNRN